MHLEDVVARGTWVCAFKPCDVRLYLEDLDWVMQTVSLTVVRTWSELHETKILTLYSLPTSKSTGFQASGAHLPSASRHCTFKLVSCPHCFQLSNLTSPRLYVALVSLSTETDFMCTFLLASNLSL